MSRIRDKKSAPSGSEKTVGREQDTADLEAEDWKALKHCSAEVVSEDIRRMRKAKELMSKQFVPKNTHPSKQDIVDREQDTDDPEAEDWEALRRGSAEFVSEDIRRMRKAKELMSKQFVPKNTHPSKQDIVDREQDTDDPEAEDWKALKHGSAEVVSEDIRRMRKAKELMSKQFVPKNTHPSKQDIVDREQDTDDPEAEYWEALRRCSAEVVSEDIRRMRESVESPVP